MKKCTILNFIIILLLPIFTFTGCDKDTTDFFVPKLTCNQEYIQMQVGDAYSLSTLYQTNVEYSNLQIFINNQSVCKLVDKYVYATKVGSTDVTVTYLKDTNVSIKITILVKEKEIFATNLTSVSKLNLNIGESKVITELYTVYPSNAKVEYLYTGNSITISDNSIIANSSGVSYITISAKASRIKTITKIIEVSVNAPKNILNAEILNADLSSCNLIIDEFLYILRFKNFEGYDFTRLSFSNNIEVVEDKTNSEYIMFEVKLASVGNYIINYDSETCVIKNNFIHRSKNLYFARLSAEGLDFINGKYIFKLGETGVDNPFAKSAKIEVGYDKNIIDDYTITLDDNKILNLTNKTISPKSTGSTYIAIAVDGVELKILVEVIKSYIENFSLEYKDFVYITEDNLVVLDVVKDFEYNYLYNNVMVMCKNSDVLINGLTIDVSNVKDKIITGKVVVGEIEKDFAIKIYRYKIDEFIVKYNDVECSELVVFDKKDILLDVSCYYKNILLNISPNYPIFVNVTNVSVIKLTADTVTKYIYISILDFGKSDILFKNEHGEVLYKFTITVENSI